MVFKEESLSGDPGDRSLLRLLRYDGSLLTQGIALASKIWLSYRRLHTHKGVLLPIILGRVQKMARYTYSCKVGPLPEQLGPQVNHHFRCRFFGSFFCYDAS